MGDRCGDAQRDKFSLWGILSRSMTPSSDREEILPSNDSVSTAEAGHLGESTTLHKRNTRKRSLFLFVTVITEVNTLIEYCIDTTGIVYCMITTRSHLFALFAQSLCTKPARPHFILHMDLFAALIVSIPRVVQPRRRAA